MKEELNKHDWSAVSNEFKLALAILKNEDEKVYKELNNSIMTNIIDEDSLESWPLFEEYRDQDKFKEILQSFKDKQVSLFILIKFILRKKKYNSFHKTVTLNVV